MTGMRHDVRRIVARYSTADEQGDEHQQHQRRELGLDHGIRGALHEPPPLVGRLVPRDPVVGRLERRQHGQQHGDVALRGRAHRRHRRGEDDPAVEHVGEQGDDQHQHHGDEQPVEHEREERQLEDVEADVGAELGIGRCRTTGCCGTAATTATATWSGGRRPAPGCRRRCSATAAAGGRTPRGTARRTGARWPGRRWGPVDRRSAG